MSAGFACPTPHSTPVDPAAHALLRAYLTARQTREAASLCRERLLSADTDAERDCWTKDLAIVKFAEGRFEDAFDLTLPLRSAARKYSGSFRGRLEVAFARSHEYLGEYDPAFELYTAGHFYAEEAGDFYLAAQIDTNTGRCYTHAGRPDESHHYLDRAYTFAVQSSDILLQAEIDESRALAFEREGKLKQALTCAARSLYLLAPTDYRLAREESKQTYDRIERNLR